VHVRCSTRAHGDFHVEQPFVDLERTRRSFVDLPWSQPDEVHGTDVLTVTAPGRPDLAVADALVTDLAGTVLGIWVGDCAPVAFVGATGRIGGAHAGWRGLFDGVLGATVAAMRAGVDDPTVVAVLGPCIHPCCYEFGDADLACVAARFGDGVVATTADGRPALDVPAAVASALAELDVALLDPAAARTHGIDIGIDIDIEGIDAPTCTGCDPRGRWFSHRVRAERARHVMAVWKDPAR
jgi:copper oxidase (laccase) domain-containing protein